VSHNKQAAQQITNKMQTRGYKV